MLVRGLEYKVVLKFNALGRENKMKKKETKEDLQAAENFFKEVSNDVKNDNMKKFWDDYGLYVIIAVAVVLTLAVSFETFKAWRVKRNESRSDTYSVALALQNQGRFDESMKLLQQIAENNNGIYGDIAQLQTSNLLFEQGKNEEAIAVLEQIIANNDINPKMRHIAAVKLASYKLDTASREEIESLLNPLIEENGSWSNIAREMMAMLAIREGNLDSAKNMYNDILNTPNLNDNFKLRVQDMLSVLDSAQ